MGPRLALLAILLAAPRWAEATECREGVTAWPEPGTSLPRNGVIIVRGSGPHLRPVAHLDERRPALACGKRVVPLKMVDLFVGHWEVEAMLVPVRRLPPRARCELVLRAPGKAGAPAWRWLDRRSADWHAYGPPPWWTTADGADRQPPVWSSAPGVVGQPRGGKGAGYASGTLQIAAPASDGEGPVLIKALLDDGEEQNDFLIALEDGRIQLAEQACWGAFSIRPASRYRVTLTAVDAGGNQARAPGMPLDVDVP